MVKVGDREEEVVIWDERGAIQRCGFLFIAYEVQYWYFEVFEITRKLLITCVARFMYPDTPAQVSLSQNRRCAFF
jgi:hypothetical protein